MTVLILAQQKLVHLRFTARLRVLSSRFEELNSYGHITFILLFCAAVLLAAYLGSFYLVLNLGFEIQKSSGRFEIIQDEFISTELALHRKNNNLAEDHGDILESMVRISGVRYLTSGGKSVVASETKRINP